MHREIEAGKELLLDYGHRCKIEMYYSVWGFSCIDEEFFQFPDQLKKSLNLQFLKTEDATTLKEQKRYLMIEWIRFWKKYIDLARNRLTRYEKSFDENEKIISNRENSLSFGARGNLLQVYMFKTSKTYLVDLIKIFKLQI